MEESKRCPRCGLVKPLSDFYIAKSGRKAGKPMGYCKACSHRYKLTWDKAHREHVTKQHLEYCHRNGIQAPMELKKDCALYLGVHIAERILSNFFDTIKRMPYGNPGYDFICGRGFKIDVKSSTLRKGNRTENMTWSFRIFRNTTADYFLCIGFDNRKDLTPMRVWLIPGDKVNHLKGLGISNCTEALRRWSKYEKPLDKVITCCNVLREGIKT